ncbi:cupin [Nocardioides mangrovicus]|uniref:Cupin n=1 Tax=Nocardioides mangrovicus TaxID=2478913 RepID=A0A3L8NZY7_9ACTN|nr:cupin domain-containing protein [Nocardioides mangrovicus]RLV47869.1 cupin [Nocardioides mangrovicus]
MISALELLSGDAQTFKEKVWASRVLLHQTEPDHLVGYLSLDDVDRLLTATAIRTPSVRVAKDGAVLPASTYTRSATMSGQPMTGLVDARRLLDLFEDGASVVLQGLQRYWEPLTELCAQLEDELGHPCQANAYLTPPGSQGFAVHSDAHDVFVFQTHGTKLWEVHEDGERRDVLLEPGLSMYLPTGTPHAARAQEGASLHVTLGINQVTWGDVLRKVVGRTLAGDEHVPAGYLDDPAALADGLRERLGSLADRLREVDVEAEAQRQIGAFLGGRPPRLRGGLRDRLALAAIEDTTRLGRRPGHPMRMRTQGESVEVLLGDRVLTVPARLTPHLERIRDLTLSSGGLSPADLVDLDPQSRVVLCRRLVREGLLEVVV